MHANFFYTTSTRFQYSEIILKLLNTIVQSFNLMSVLKIIVLYLLVPTTAMMLIYPIVS